MPEVTRACSQADVKLASPVHSRRSGLPGDAGHAMPPLSFVIPCAIRTPA